MSGKNYDIIDHVNGIAAGGIYGALPVASATDLVTAVGAKNDPASGTLDCKISCVGPFFSLTFTLTALRITVTDSGVSGSYGSHKLFDFVQGGIVYFASRADYTAFAEGSALTTAAGDAVHVLGLGSAAIAAAADGTLTGTQQDIGTKTSNITNSGGTGTGTKHSFLSAIGFDGTTTANDIYLNWSGTAATIDANSTIDVTGTITVLGAFIGDD